MVEEGLDELGLNDASSGVGFSLKTYPCLDLTLNDVAPPLFSFAVKYYSCHRFVHSRADR
jgi:hypothetical protein